jgi:hypothetical protein
VTIDDLHGPAVGFEALGCVFALGLIGHGVERNVIGVVNENEVVEGLVAGKSRGFARNAFLQAAVARETNDMEIKDRVIGRIETRSGHLAGHGHADGIAHALAERAGGALDTGGHAILGVAGCF